MSDGGWEPVQFPRPKPEPVPGEVELWGGPADGDFRAVEDIDAPIVLGNVLGEEHV